MRRSDLRKSKYVDDGKMERDTERLANMLENFKSSAARHEEMRKNTHWESSRAPVRRSNTKNLKISNIKNLSKIKIITLRPNESKKESTSKMGKGIYPLHCPVEQCGQCEKTSAAMLCQECGEKFCIACFSRFHVKGALAKHHSMPVKISKTLSRKPLESKPYSADSLVFTGCNNAFLKGAKSESCSTNSEVGIGVSLHPPNDMRKDTSKNSSSVGTGPQAQRKSNAESPAITFLPHMSYAERLLLERHRRNALFDGNRTQKKIEDFDENNSSDAQEEVQDDWRAQEEPDMETLHRLSLISLKGLHSVSNFNYLPPNDYSNNTPAHSCADRSIDIKKDGPLQNVANGDDKSDAEWSFLGSSNEDPDAQKTIEVMEQQIKELTEYFENSKRYEM